MEKYLKITEYSKYSKNMLPNLNGKFEHEFELGDSIIRTSVFSEKDRIYESYNTAVINKLNELKIEENIIPLKDVVVYDEIDISDNEQKLAYVFECPICLYKILTTQSNVDTCPICENTNFPPRVIALINQEQMEDIAINNKDTSSLLLVDNDSIVYKDLKSD